MKPLARSKGAGGPKVKASGPRSALQDDIRVHDPREEKLFR